MSQRIYFDESGFTGNNLPHPHQTLFAYASIATNDTEAQNFVEELIRKYGLQNGEMAGLHTPLEFTQLWNQQWVQS